MGGQRRREIRGQEPLLGRTANHTRIYSAKGGKIIVMDIALAIVDQPARNLPVNAQTQWVQKQIERSCGLTARKEGTYQRGSKQKHRRYVPADRVYYIQSAYPFQ